MMVMNIAADKNRKRKKQIQERTLGRGNSGLTRGSLGWAGPTPDPTQPWALLGQQEPLGQPGLVPRNSSLHQCPHPGDTLAVLGGTRNSCSPRERAVGWSEGV